MKGANVMSETDERVTCCGDVVKLLDYKGERNERSFSLCKTVVLKDTERTESDKWIYMLILKNDKYPVIITEECARSILENPKKGETLAYNRWFDRYR